MAQRVKRETVEVLIKPANFWKLMHNTALEIVDVRTVNDCMVVKFRRQTLTPSFSPDQTVKKTPSQIATQIGSFFGQLTDEVDGEMERFVTIGPKTYFYVEKKEEDERKTVRKGKGITINSSVDKKFTFALMKKMVDEVLEKRAEKTIAEFEQFTMTRNKNHQVFA
ncbi:hypothetical protein CAEBREN_16315 [Caenorhabditis brenneri]|uniref:Uncharacterized protein n=1 Tax=Caenorhabditis brenneri TaxID=135651 RepID=G0NDD5_CAEBE|nr:hypothetical protein CAEBREN_16315 [Caenorhabditis brenneri]